MNDFIKKYFLRDKKSNKYLFTSIICIIILTLLIGNINYLYIRSNNIDNKRYYFDVFDYENNHKTLENISLECKVTEFSKHFNHCEIDYKLEEESKIEEILNNNNINYSISSETIDVETIKKGYIVTIITMIIISIIVLSIYYINTKKKTRINNKLYTTLYSIGMSKNSITSKFISLDAIIYLLFSLLSCIILVINKTTSIRIALLISLTLCIVTLTINLILLRKELKKK